MLTAKSFIKINRFLFLFKLINKRYFKKLSAIYAQKRKHRTMTFETYLNQAYWPFVIFRANFLVSLLSNLYNFPAKKTGPNDFRGRRKAELDRFIIRVFGYLFSLCVYFYDIGYYPFCNDPSFRWKLQCAEIWWFKCQNARKKKVFMAKNIYGHK